MKPSMKSIRTLAHRAIRLFFLSLCFVSVNPLKGVFCATLKTNRFTVRPSTFDTVTWSPRIQKIKNLSLHKDILRDITASEFALRLEATHSNKDQIVDFDRLICKLDSDLLQIERRRSMFSDSDGLISRILRVREDLQLASQNLPLKNTEFIITEPFESTPTAQMDPIPVLDASKVNMKELRDNLRIRIREDGTVDWDGTLASGKEIAKFGVELWERLNGKEEGVPTFAELFGQAQEKSITSPEIEHMSRLVREAQQDVIVCVRERENAKTALRKARREGLVVSKDDIQAVKRMDLQVKELSKRAKLLGLNLDMEKICAYLQRELEASAEPSELRGLVAQVSLIDRQLTGVLTGLDFGIGGTPAGGKISKDVEDGMQNTAQGVLSENAQTASLEALLLVDEDEVNLISTVVQDLKSRLGIDTQQLLPTMDWGSLGTFVKENISRVKSGLTFFKEGTSLLVSDVQYAWLLFRKAIRGYTLKPREVNAVRRAGRDMLTLIPFTIILIVPLTPIGHVLVFTFIQRYFPDFFPSCYTEKRLNLRRLFSEVERRSDDLDPLEAGSLLDSVSTTASAASSQGRGLVDKENYSKDDGAGGRTSLMGGNLSAVANALCWTNLRRVLSKLVQPVDSNSGVEVQSAREESAEQ